MPAAACSAIIDTGGDVTQRRHAAERIEHMAATTRYRPAHGPSASGCRRAGAAAARAPVAGLPRPGRFKPVNDALGMRRRRRAAAAVAAPARRSAGRRRRRALGGDEFAALLPPRRADALEWARARCRRCCRCPYEGRRGPGSRSAPAPASRTPRRRRRTPTRCSRAAQRALSGQGAGRLDRVAARREARHA
jgi:hypothetical protein